MELDERIENENDLNLMVGPAKHQIQLSALLLVIGQFEQSGDTGQLVEDMDTLGVEVIE